MKFCNKCQTNKPISSFSKQKDKKDGIRSTCKSCDKQRSDAYLAIETNHEQRKLKGREFHHKYRQRRNAQSKLYGQTLAGRFRGIKNSAHFRNINFNISLKEYKLFFKKPCFYCGIISTGLDRVNNEEGYVIQNIVSCCSNCNTKKSSITIEMCRKIISFHKHQNYNLDAEYW